MALSGDTAETRKLSPQEERKWNKLSVTMNAFHENFKQEFNRLYELADGSFNNYGWSLSYYLNAAQGMKTHLTTHHTIEERYIFPTLGKRMPAFADTPDGEHWNSHKGIHDGLDALAELLNKYRRDQTTYSPSEMRECLDSFREVLFNHLDQEVQDLRGENLRKYFSMKEIEPMLSL
ncbi:hypothetical protein BDN71DRAFT_1501236 [Pleurotus eryngii]|uniref:Hemerythrin-like domain-containing protein n=1 Tax=Pleurotus eryngii TaxID=5323 RepID=A0A9P6ABB7_PLEER|nr:hypothetical protein BDN71DRAFT_1501236 [Pleurotus eryngii]